MAYGELLENQGKTLKKPALSYFGVSGKLM